MRNNGEDTGQAPQGYALCDKMTRGITNTDHSHLIVPGIGLAFFASKPQARTCPSSLYKRQVGILRKVSKDPGQWSICCTCPAAIRDEP